MSSAPTKSIFDSERFWNQSLLSRGFVTIGLIVLALVVTEALWLLVDRPISSTLFLVAIAVTAWICGFRMAVVSTVIAGFLIDYCFIQPQYEFHGTRDEIVRLIVFIFEGTAISWLVRKLKLADEQIRSKNLELRALTDHQQRLREEEQKRIAREVHDELGQSLTGLKMNLHLLKTQAVDGSENSSIENRVDDLMQMTDSTIATVRRIAGELRPSLLDDFGLVSAVEWQTQEFERRTSIPCKFTSNCDSIDLGSERNTAMYRVVQEALTNVARHARAENVEVEFATDNSEVRVSIIDNGVGFDVSSRKSPSLGLIGMQERSRMIGGELQIAGSPASGTTVILKVPAKNGKNGNGSQRGVN
jgi:signal transduction histidine kinase